MDKLAGMDSARMRDLAYFLKKESSYKGVRGEGSIPFTNCDLLPKCKNTGV